MRWLGVRSLVRLLVVAVPSLAAATALIWLLEDGLGIPNASAVYLLAVVATAIASGTLGAMACAVIGFGLYDYLFTQPRLTFVVQDPGEWLNLLLLLFVALVVGQLTGLQRARAEVAVTREREARELFGISRVLATRQSTPSVLPDIAAILATATGMERVWISLGRDDAGEHLAAESRPRAARVGMAADRGTAGAPHEILRRMPGDVPAEWVRVHPPAGGRVRDAADRERRYRVRIEAAGQTLGSIWCARSPRDATPERTAARLLATAADQIGQALTQDRLAAEARVAEISRESDALKSALLQSVSHDLRTPLAAIRAAAGTLRPDSGLSDSDRRESADAIEAEVERLDRLVANLLDLSRIEAGALRADREIFELDDLVGRVVDRFESRLGGFEVRVELSSAPVLVDPVFLDEVVTNVLENAAKFTPPGAPIHLTTDTDAAPGFVRLTVADGGPGVPVEALGRIFDKFFQQPLAGGGAPAGTGIGLSVARGLAEAMGARVSARHSELGGLAVDIDLPAAELPADLTPTLTR